VDEAITAYLADYAARSGRATAQLTYAIEAHIRPIFGALLLCELRTDLINNWRNTLVTMPPRRRTPASGQQDSEQRRQAAHRAEATTAAQAGEDREAKTARERAALERRRSSAKAQERRHYAEALRALDQQRGAAGHLRVACSGRSASGSIGPLSSWSEGQPISYLGRPQGPRNFGNDPNYG
jgi:hypothetical protein